MIKLKSCCQESSRLWAESIVAHTSQYVIIIKPRNQLGLQRADEHIHSQLPNVCKGNCRLQYTAQATAGWQQVVLALQHATSAALDVVSVSQPTHQKCQGMLQVKLCLPLLNVCMCMQH
jgi:hypothetical protein